jgi:hypothetical protein
MTSRTADFRSPLVRFSRMNVFKPRANKKDPTKLKFEANLIIPKDGDLSEIKAAIIEAAVAEWGEKARESLKKGTIKNPILDGDGPQGMNKTTEEQYPELEGMWFIRTASNLQPKLYNKKVKPAIEGTDLYSGCYGYAVIHAYTWDNAENGKGVSIGLSMCQMVKDGEKLGGREADPDQFFKNEAGDAPEETQGGDGASALFD